MSEKNSLIACEKFVVTFEDVLYAYRLELRKSGAFEYGNGCCCLVYVDNVILTHLDLRYVKGCSTPELFHTWALEWLIGYCAPECKIERVV